MTTSRRFCIVLATCLVACTGADEGAETVIDPTDVLTEDLKNLATHQERFYADSFSYSSSLDAIGFSASVGASVAVVGDSVSWMGVITSEDGSAQCVLWFGRRSEATTLEQRVGETSPEAIRCVGGPDDEG